ncbi:adenylate/guanylate cyclase domain-containing protein [Microvirga massiliensis]|uniref:adenylate/guanylate cyclase domain-containing protein n=1 Tax=Microvirga massiliensis TaxID=1033741 RepID=UPI00062B6D44|nr:adenylate/guanylate cyclase domain-containing protein [Microvirga massiliensis]
MPGPVSVRWRLLVAFFGISAFAVLGAAAAMWAVLELGQVLERTTEEHAPAALALLELSRQAERIAAAAPALLAAPNEAGRAKVAADIRTQLARLEEILAKLRDTSSEAIFGPIEASVARLGSNLDALDRLVAERLAIAQAKAKLLSRLSATVVGTHRLVTPGILVLDSQVAEWRHAGGNGSGEVLARAVAGFVPLQKAQLEIAAINSSLLKAADAPSPADVSLLAFPLKRSLSALEAIASEFEPSLRDRFLDRVRELAALAMGSEGLPAVRERELDALSRGERMLAENATLSGGLTEAVDRLVASAKADIAAASAESKRVQELSTGVLGTIVLASLLSSALIVWLYVDRNLLARLAGVSQSMLAIAGGDLRTPVPASGSDEIGRMAEALRHFRETAREVEEKNLREVAKARQRLVDAIETISEGFALFDADDRLVLCNSRYGELLYAGREVELRAGMTFASIVRRAAEGGYIMDAEGRVEDWIADRIRRHQKPGEPVLQRRVSGRWIMVSERRTEDGGIVAVYSDITELKQHEEVLSEKTAALEALSRKLAKYLAPQVYNSIFTGSREVKIASERKKLTVCFSDIAGFTEITDKMESEDLTQLLNHYLTEMSNIAAAYGATIDKYVGDAILMFFGDPETRGIREDALACVKMALAMQKRIGELAEVWRQSGVETPLSCRIGIHTGYCTVGNFGSEDRMDYTIVGGAVNLASRLEHEAVPGGVLISYETYVHVSEEVRCEERGHIRVKGLAYPVAVYEVVALERDLDATCDRIDVELPHLRLELEAGLMSKREVHQALATLRKALRRLESNR